MELWEKQSIFSQNVSALIHQISRQNFACTLGEVYRTHEQAEWYAKAGAGIINSLHCKKLAIDISLFEKDGTYLTDKKDYEPFGIFWKQLHPKNKWGGDWVRADCTHFQMDE